MLVFRIYILHLCDIIYVYIVRLEVVRNKTQCIQVLGSSGIMVPSVIGLCQCMVLCAMYMPCSNSH